MFEKDEEYRKARKASKDRITKVIKVWSAREESIHDEGFKKVQSSAITRLMNGIM